MITKTASFNSGAGTHNALVEEANFLSCSVSQHFNDAAGVVVELFDKDGSVAQKYGIATNNVFMGAGRIIIQEPSPEPDDDTTNLIFDGRILKATHDSTTHRVTLLCQDWSHQLTEDRIPFYDMKEAIDGSELKKSHVRTDIDGTLKKPVFRNIFAFVTKDGGTYAEDTEDANNDDPNDMEFFPNPSALDGCLFGFRAIGAAAPLGFVLNVSTAGVGTYSFIWKYSTGAGTWGNLSGVSDNTNNFKTAGANTVTWTSVPGDWVQATYDGVTAYWVMAHMTAFVNMPTPPLGAWAYNEYFMYDDSMKHHWATDDWNGKYLVFPNDMAGSVTISTGPISEEIEISASMVLNEPTAGETAVWDDDHQYHHMTEEDNDDFMVKYTFIQPIELSNLFLGDLTGARIKCEYTLENAVEPPLGYLNRAWLYDGADFPGSKEIGKLTVNTVADKVAIQRATWEIPEQYLDYVLDDDTGECKIALSVDVGAALATLKVHKIRLEVDVDLRGYADAVEIIDTIEEEGVAEAFTLVDGAVARTDNWAWVPTYTTETAAAQNATQDDMTLVDMEGYESSYYYFGINELSPPNGPPLVNGVKINIYSTTFLPWYYFPPIFQWQYSLGGDVWKNLLDVVDGTNNFRTIWTRIVSWSRPDDWATDTVNAVGPMYWIRIKISGGVAIEQATKGTQAWFLTEGSSKTTKLQVGTDLTHTHKGVGIYEGCPYHIIKPIHDHIDDLVTGAEFVSVDSTLTTDVEHTSGLTTRDFTEKTIMEMLRALAKMDRVVFWVPLGTRQLKWMNTTDDSFTAITDANVLSWSTGEYSYHEMKNEFHIYGIKIGDKKLFVNTGALDPDPGAASKIKYGVTRSDAIMNSGTTSEFEAKEMGESLVNRNMGLPLFLSAIISGFSAYKPGDWLRITSTYLNLTNADYVVTDFSYSSKGDLPTTNIHLQPRTTLGYVDHVLYGEHVRRISERVKTTELDKYLG